MYRLKYNILDIIKNNLCKIPKTPIIVTGNQKSGTSAIASLLAEFGKLSSTIDIPVLWNKNVTNILISNKLFSELVSKNRQYFIKDLIKEPNIIFIITQVINFFPNAQYLFIVRNPLDNIRSILNNLNMPGDLNDLDTQYKKSSLKLQYLFDTRLWGGKNENYIGILAYRWNVAIENYLIYCNKMLCVRYEDFLKDKVSSIDFIAQKLNIQQKKNIASKVDFQYQPKGESNVDLHSFYGKENFEKIINICSSNMQIFDYKT